MYKIIFLVFLLASSFVQAGSEGVGGGDILPAEQIGSKAIEEMIIASKLELLMHFYHLDQNRSRLPTAYQNLIGSNNDLIEQMRLQKIYINSFGPCFDFAGNESDASVFPKEGPGICLSSYRLGKKLSKENARIQLLALLAHEYSHLVGADENQAQAVQREILVTLLNSSHKGAEIYYQAYSLSIFETSLQISKVEKALNSNENATLCYMARELANKFYELYDKSSQNHYSISSLDIQKLINTVYWQAESIAAGACVLYRINDEFDLLYANYNKAFGSASYIKLLEFKKYVIPNYGIDFVDENFEVQKITDSLILKKELKRLERNLHILEVNTVDNIYFIINRQSF